MGDSARAEPGDEREGPPADPAAFEAFEVELLSLHRTYEFTSVSDRPGNRSFTKTGRK
jgi:hypothetical protein